MKSWMKVTLGVVLGGLAGFAYYGFVGCASGTCAIISNPVNSTLYGAVVGLVLALPSRQRSGNRQRE